MLASCFGKERFAKPVVAHRALRRMKAVIRHSSLNVYKCKRCGGWHIGNSGWSSEMDDAE